MKRWKELPRQNPLVSWC